MPVEAQGLYATLIVLSSSLPTLRTANRCSVCHRGVREFLLLLELSSNDASPIIRRRRLLVLDMLQRYSCGALRWQSSRRLSLHTFILATNQYITNHIKKLEATFSRWPPIDLINDDWLPTLDNLRNFLLKPPAEILSFFQISWVQ